MSETSFLFAVPSLAEGIGRLVDLGGVFDDYNYSPTPEGADLLALAMDWKAVGADLSSVFQSFLPDVLVKARVG